jgi:hypothetical protein
LVDEVHCIIAMMHSGAVFSHSGNTEVLEETYGFSFIHPCTFLVVIIMSMAI